MLVDYDAENNYMDRAKLVMKFLGVWLPSKNESLLSKVYRYFTISLQYLFLIFQIIYIIQVTIFLLNEESLSELLAKMNLSIFKPQTIEHESILEFQAARIKRLLLAFVISSQATCGLWALKPLFDDAEVREFPFRMWMPVTTDKSPHYEIGYAVQLLTICTSAYIYYGVDSVALSMVIFGCAQIDIIKDKIVKIKHITMEDRASGRVQKLFEDNYKELVTCIIQHQTILKFIEKVENTFHTYLLFQLSGSVGLICMSALRILAVDWQSMQFFSILTYLSVMVMQLYVCCWCGHELTANSEDLYAAMTECPWYEQSVKFRRALIFAMMRMIRPMVFRAGHYVPLSRQTFVSILRTSYSYFAVLRQTHH